MIFKKVGLLTLLTVFLTVTAVVVFKDIVIKNFIESGVEAASGLKISIRSIDIGVIKSAVSVKGLKLFNPVVFKDRIMLDIPEVYIDYDLAAMMNGKVHLEELYVHLKELLVVKNEKGELNLDYLSVVKAFKEGKSPQAKKGQAPDIKIDKLRLKIEKAVYKDYSKGREPSVKEFNVNIDETYNDVDDLYSLFSLLVVRTLTNTPISALANFDLRGLAGTVSTSVRAFTSKAAEVANQAMKHTGTDTVVKGTQDTIKKAAEQFKGLFNIKEGGE